MDYEKEIELNISQKKIKLIILGAALLLVSVFTLLFASPIYTLNEQEQAVLVTFGKTEVITIPGLKFKIPFVQQVKKVTKEIQGVSVGYDINTNESIERESLMITKDFNFVNTDFYIEYQITDPIQYLYASKEPEAILKNLAQSYIRDTIGTYNVDDVITTAKGEIQGIVKEKLGNRLENENIGLTVINVTIQDAEPPTVDVIEAFKAVETAKQGKETSINNANKYKSEKLPEARAKADSIVKEATAKKEARINEANGQASRFNTMYEEYKNFPLVTKQRMFFEAMNEILPKIEVIIDAGDGSKIVIPSNTLGGQ